MKTKSAKTKMNVKKKLGELAETKITAKTKKIREKRSWVTKFENEREVRRKPI